MESSNNLMFETCHFKGYIILKKQFDPKDCLTVKNYLLLKFYYFCNYLKYLTLNKT